MVWRNIRVADLEYFYKGRSGHPFLDPFEFREIIKEAGAITTSIGTAVWNPIYGAQVWAQLNTEANLFGILPKVTWPRSGVRVITALAQSTPAGGISETATIPDAYRPSVSTFKPTPKQVAHTFEASDIMQALHELGADDVWGSIDQLRTYFAMEHRRHIAAMLGTDITTTAGYNFESIDRICGSSSEADAGLCDAGDEDIYSIDRSANTWANAVVLHNSGTDRSLTDELIRTLLQNVRQNGANTNVMATGYDTYAKIQGLYSNFVRYMPLSETQIQITVEGIQTAKGINAGIQVAQLFGIPLIVSQDVPKDTISRIYALDTTDPEGYGVGRLNFSTIRPTEYFETRDPFVAGKFAVKGVYRTVGEVVCRFFKAEGKLRDLQ